LRGRNEALLLKLAEGKIKLTDRYIASKRIA
jgi:hypothetical protein